MAGLGVLLWGCSTGGKPSDSKNSDQAWLESAQIMRALEEEADTVYASDEARAEHKRQVLALSKQADVVFELWGTEHMQLQSPNIIGFPEGPFPISDLEKYLRARKGPRRIPFVVVNIPSEVVEPAGKPTLIDAMREISIIMRRNGVKKLMFMTESYSDLFELHSGPERLTMPGSN